MKITLEIVHLSGDGLFLFGLGAGIGASFSVGDFSWNFTSVLVGISGWGSIGGPVGLN